MRDERPRTRLARISITAVALTLAGLAHSPHEARADARSEREAAAQSLYDSATALMDAHDYANACPKLEEVTSLVPEGLGARLTLAECYEGEGKLASAWAEYAIVAPRAARAGQGGRQEKAEAKMTELGPRVARLTIAVDAKLAETAGLTISRDGVDVGRAQWGIAVPIDAGDHVIEARAPGKIATRRELHVDDATTPSVVLEPLVEAPVTERPQPRPRPEPEPLRPLVPEKVERPWQAPMGYAVGGVGLASAGIGFVLGGLAVGKASEASLDCDRNLVCNARGMSLRKEGRTLADASTGLLVAGGVLAATGLVLVVTAPRAKTVRARAGAASLTIEGDL